MEEMQMFSIILLMWKEMQLIIQHIPCALLSRRSLEQHVSSQYSVNLTTREELHLFLHCGISMLSMYFFNVKESAVIFYALAGVTQFFFSGFNTAIYAIIPDCVEYGEWKTGLRNDGFQYAFVSLGNKIGMAIGTAMLAMLLGKYGYVANQTQNSAVISIMKHSFSTIPGILWIVTAIVLFFYRLNKKRYNEIVEDLKNGKRGQC